VVDAEARAGMGSGGCAEGRQGPGSFAAAAAVLGRFEPLFSTWLCSCDGRSGLNPSPFDLYALACTSHLLAHLHAPLAGTREPVPTAAETPPQYSWSDTRSAVAAAGVRSAATPSRLRNRRADP
jgi:hypothetical protein